MPTKRMLVDAIHPEETRIVVTSGNKLEEFDFESASRRQLRGNIYLAKVTRVEPSLQAAFVEYGGNRHGFLAFSEIHPDYYQIPVADREALIAAEEAEDAEYADAEAPPSEADASEESNAEGDEESGNNGVQSTQSDETVDSVGGDDAIEEAQQRKRAMHRKYKIQEVIKRRQVMLVQVVKEERGNKGAALTTYLSLAGRYSVLMPNTARGGGISRKITNSTDRKRLKEIASELEVPQGMGIILRTAGALRTKAEVKRDFEYLMRLWENVRSLTLQSSAPCLVYEEGSLIKRTIRDLYNKDIDEVLIAGEDAYKEAKDFMRMIMPSHAKNVQQYKEDQPIFSKFSIEPQLDSMFSPQVTLPSGGYIVINPTEALVSIDVNSGRSTREHNIEDTAYQTNLEAADEVARQLRLRDLAGLIVIDFIDMLEKRSIRNVERRLKDALKNDRARIQVGRISHFGLMEMSRQRIRFGVVESSTHICPTCHGAGIVRSVESLALMVMRAIEDHAMRKAGMSMNVRVPTDVALYLLNTKRASLMDLEARNNISVVIAADAKLAGNHFQIERGEARGASDIQRPAYVSVDSADMTEVEESEDTPEVADEDDHTSGRRRRRRRGGRGRSDNDQRQSEPAAAEDGSAGDAEAEEIAQAHPANADSEDDGQRKRRRRGRRGGRRNRRPNEVGEFEAQDSIEGVAHDRVEPEVAEGVTDLSGGVPAQGAAAAAEEGTESASAREPEGDSDAKPAQRAIADAQAPAEEAEKPKKPRRTRRKKADIEAEAKLAAEAAEAASAPAVAEPAAVEPEPAAPEPAAAEPEVAKAKPKRRSRKALPPEGVVVTSTATEDAKSDDDTDKPKKSGWWQRGFLS